MTFAAVRGTAERQLRSAGHASEIDPRLSTELAATLVGLANCTTRRPSLPSLLAITAGWSLGAIFDATPAGYRKLIAELRNGDQLSFGDTTRLSLTTPSPSGGAAQDVRTSSILAHRLKSWNTPRPLSHRGSMTLFDPGIDALVAGLSTSCAPRHLRRAAAELASSSSG